MSSSSRIVAALVAGLAFGALVARTPSLAPAGEVAAAVGQVWLRALQMTVVPLVASLLITGVCAAATAGMLGRQGRRMLLLCTALLLASGTLAALVGPLVLGAIPIPDGHAIGTGSAAGLEPGSAGGSWIDSVLPLNPIRAAADGAMLPTVVFVLLFAIALTRLSAEAREPLVRAARTVSEAMQVIVGWVLWLAPLGVFGAAVPLVARSGGALAGAFGYYLALNIALLLAVTALVYPLGAWATRGGLRVFARAVAPAQAIAASTRSSVATLPAMLEAAPRLGVAPATGAVTLPLAVVLFRITTPAAAMVSLLFVARYEGVPVSASTLVLLVAASAAVSLGVVGVPGQASYFVTRLPMFAIAGVPTGILGALLVVDFIPDVFRTVGNVTADLAVTASVGRDAVAVAPEVSAETAPIGPTAADVAVSHAPRVGAGAGSA